MSALVNEARKVAKGGHGHPSLENLRSNRRSNNALTCENTHTRCIRVCVPRQQGVAMATFGHPSATPDERSHMASTRRARQAACPRCGSPVLAGLDADRMAGEAVINPTPITPAQELTEWAAGRRTYTYSPISGRIDYRTHGSLTPSTRVHATHTCPKEEPLW